MSKSSGKIWYIVVNYFRLKFLIDDCINEIVVMVFKCSQGIKKLLLKIQQLFGNHRVCILVCLTLSDGVSKTKTVWSNSASVYV